VGPADDEACAGGTGKEAAGSTDVEAPRDCRRTNDSRH
jgi:hypothetical protein